MTEKAALERLRDEYDTWQLLDAVDALDKIRSIVADGPNLEPPEVRNELLRLHKVAREVINEGGPLSSDADKNPGSLAFELECKIGLIREAAEKILDALGELIRLCPDEEELEEDEGGEDEEEF